jgi:hypothetical protein
MREIRPSAPKSAKTVARLIEIAETMTVSGAPLRMTGPCSRRKSMLILPLARSPKTKPPTRTAHVRAKRSLKRRRWRPWAASIDSRMSGGLPTGGIRAA